MDKRYQVFVSSTYADLREEREAVIQALMEMDCIPAGMELFPAADDEQLEFIKRVIDDCDYYILIIGGRYGSTTAEGISYTEMEYEYAKGKGLKVLAFIHEKPEEIALGKSEVESDLRDRLNKFRDKVSKGRLVKMWSAAKDLPGLVALSLSKTIKAYPAIGWARADKMANLDLLNEINELQKRNQELEKLIQKQKTIFTESEEAEFKYIWDDIDKLTNISISVAHKTDNITAYDMGLCLRYLFSRFTEISTHSYNSAWVGDHVIDSAKEQQLIPNNTDYEYKIEFSEFNKIIDDLIMYGFVETRYRPTQPSKDGALAKMMASLDIVRTDFVYTPKIHRFKYWLAYNKLIPEYLEFQTYKIINMGR